MNSETPDVFRIRHEGTKKVRQLLHRTQRISGQHIGGKEFYLEDPKPLDRVFPSFLNLCVEARAGSRRITPCQYEEMIHNIYTRKGIEDSFPKFSHALRSYSNGRGIDPWSREALIGFLLGEHNQQTEIGGIACPFSADKECGVIEGGLGICSVMPGEVTGLGEYANSPTRVLAYGRELRAANVYGLGLRERSPEGPGSRVHIFKLAIFDTD